MLLRGRLFIWLALAVTAGALWLWNQFLEANPEYARLLRAHPGFMAPARTDATPIKVKLGEKYYAIPAYYFDAPLGNREGDRLVIRKEGDVYLESGALLVGYMPDFGPRQKGWDWEEALYRDVHVLIDRPGVPVEKGFSNIKELRFEDFNEVVSGSVTETETHRAGQLFQKRFKENSDGIKDFFEEKATGFYVICDRRGDGVRNPLCESYSHDGNVLFKMHFDRGYMADRDKILETVRAKLKSWEFEPAGNVRHDGQ